MYSLARPPLLEVNGLSITVTPPGGGRVTAVEDLSFNIQVGEAVGLVGESGSGKSLTLRAVLGILPPGTAVSAGSVQFEGKELLADSGTQLRSVRGHGITMIFQEPMTALNPVVRIGEQIVDAARAAFGWSRAEGQARAVRLAQRMGIPDAEACLSLYPHELSGGMRQRVMIAAALASEPRLLLCDEPTTALDVTIQAQIVQLLRRLRAELNMSLLYVTHDLALVGQLCQRVEVMYAGRVVESGPTSELFNDPRHPYTRGLLRATPDVDVVADALIGIPGTAPPVDARPAGCAFHPRCAFASEACRSGKFLLRALGGSRASACILADRMGDLIEVEA